MSSLEKGVVSQQADRNGIRGPQLGNGSTVQVLMKFITVFKA
jgi:hypothetical protein